MRISLERAIFGSIRLVGALLTAILLWLLVAFWSAGAGVAAAQVANATIGGDTTRGGQPVPGVAIDLFTADADGNRLTWLESTVTDADGGYGFTVDPGCYAVTAIAPDNQVFTNNSRWVTTAPLCVGAGDRVDGIDADVATDEPGRVTGTVENQRGVLQAGIVVDLFRATEGGGRAEYLTSATTADDGRFELPAQPGRCYVVTYIAGAEQTWVDSGSPWRNAPACVPETGTADLAPAIINGGASEPATLDVLVGRNGVAVGGVKVDLFAANGDGSRGAYLTSFATAAAGRTEYALPPGVGCLVLTFIAPIDTVFADTGSPWLNRPVCAQPGATERIDVALQDSSVDCAANAEFELVFRDDFDGTELGPDWSAYNSAGNAGYGLRRPSAVSVADGQLVITAAMENESLVSGGISHNLNQTYGKFRFRVRTDNDPGQALSGEILTWPGSGVHPRDGENNIYSTLVQTPERNPFYTFIHHPFGTAADQEYFIHNADGSQFQIMTMEWTPDRITIVREGPGGVEPIERFVLAETDADLIPDVDHRLAIQLDAWKHEIAAPVTMVVDWVEVHRYCGQ